MFAEGPYCLIAVQSNGDEKNHVASAGNRTRAARVAGEHSTTEPPMLMCQSGKEASFAKYRLIIINISDQGLGVNISLGSISLIGTFCNHDVANKTQTYAILSASLCLRIMSYIVAAKVPP